VGDGLVQCGKVAERYIYFAPDKEEVRHLVLQHADLLPGRLNALHLTIPVEGTNCFHIDLATAAAHGLTIERGTPASGGLNGPQEPARYRA
jgi:hypothetical protein